MEDDVRVCVRERERVVAMLLQNDARDAES